MNDPAAKDPLLYQQGECNETSGFLFSHRCGEAALNTCVQCQKPICQRHTFIDPNNAQETFCTTCGRRFVQDQGTSPDGSSSFDSTNTQRGYGWYGADPYYYTGYHYYGYSHGGYGRSSHSHTGGDFTDADERSISGGEPTREAARMYENDMGGS